MLRGQRDGCGVSAVVFDLGGVLIDWDPRHLYRSLFDGDEAAMERFLSEVCTMDWNEEQDAGRPFAEGVALLSREHPHLAELIEAYDREWPRMLRGAIDDSLAIAFDLHVAGVPLYALSNWSAEKYPIAEERFPFLSWFDGIVISGRVGMRKPDPRIFAHLAARFDLVPAETLFIDDSERNVEAARRAGYRAVRFVSAGQLRGELERVGLR